MTPGYPSIKRSSISWSRFQIDTHLIMASIGVLAGIVVTFIQTPLHLPGHKVIFWLSPVLASRLITKARIGASISSCTTALTTLLLGGRLAGGAAMTPMIILAGLILDASVIQIEKHHLVTWQRVMILALAAMVGNIVCCIKRVAEDGGPAGHGLISVGMYYAFFGFFAGLIGAAVGFGILRRTRKSGGAAI